MQNQEIVKIIENLKGRRSYEEKRASKLGFASLYDYFEDKISKKQKILEDEQKELEASKIEDLKGKWTHLKFHVLWKLDETGRFKIYKNNEVIADLKNANNSSHKN